MNIQEAKELFEIARNADDTVIMQGKHGIGKSAIVREFAKDSGFYLTELFLSNQEVGDLIGYPITSDGIQYWSVPEWLHRMYEESKKGKHCILHLDELNRADPDVLQAALQLVLEGKIHEHSLPILDSKRTFIIASVNPPGEEYNVHELDPALLDRFLVLKVKPDLKAFIEFCSNNSIDPRIPEFLELNPNYLHFTPKDPEDKCATPRGWAKLSGYLSQFNSISNKQKLNILTGKIGIIPGTEFLQFLNTADVSLSDIIEAIEMNKSKYSDLQELADSLPKLKSPVLRTRAIHQIKDTFQLLAYLYSLDQEILISSLKELRQEPIFQELVKLDSALNDKGLFKKATSQAI